MIRRRYAKGGMMALGAASALGANVLSTLDTDDLGYQSQGSVIGQGVFRGASAGASFGPLGAGIGAGLGLAQGLITSGVQRRQESRTRRRIFSDKTSRENLFSQGYLGNNPEEFNGYQGASYFKYGGSIGGGEENKKPRTVTNQDRNEWNNYVNWLRDKKVAGDPSLDKNGLGFKYLDDYVKVNPNTTLSRDLIAPIQADLLNYRTTSLAAIKQGKAIFADGVTEATYMPNLSKIDGYPGQYTTSYRFPMEYMRTVDKVAGTDTTVNKGFAADKKFAMGGNIKMKGGHATPISNGTYEFKGASHNNGGIDIPGTNVNVENGETIAGDFVFSDVLGFAKAHKKLSKKIGLLESLPATSERINTYNKYKEQEESLAAMQELLKSRNGIQ